MSLLEMNVGQYFDPSFMGGTSTLASLAFSCSKPRDQGSALAPILVLR
jgi:hypothetical protein